MTISNEKVVSLTYELRLNDSEGDVVETVNNDNPLTFVYGTGRLLPKFEENLSGLAVGDDFSFTLKSDEAYGNIDDNAVVDVPLKAFEVDGKIDDNLLQVGNNIPMQDNAGNRLNGRVKNIGDELVTMDFNHPLAGETLHFNGKVADLRDATPDELEGNSCGCGSCGCSDEEKEGCC